MKIGLIYNFVDTLERGIELDKIADNEIVSTVDHIYTALSSHHEVIPVRISPDTLSDIAEARFDVIFNLCEGIGGNVAAESLVPAILDLFHIPYTGSDHITLGLCLDKARTKQFLMVNGIPTPRFQVFNTIAESLVDELSFPLIVKPLHEDASIGITEESVVYNSSQLNRQILRILEQYKQPALVEEYIDGREINIALYGNGSDIVALPASEILFDFDSSIPHIVDYESKWIEDSFKFTHTNGKCPADLEPKISEQINNIAKKAYEITGCRDYARVDFRLSGSEIYVLEVNPNPGINIDSGYVRSAKTMGWTYVDLIHKILNSALKRYNMELLNQKDNKESNSPFFQSSRLDFYPITYSHLDLMYTWFNNPHINQYMVEPEGYTSKDQLVKDFLLHPANSAISGIALMIYERSAHIPIGYGAIYDTTLWNQTAEISYLIGNSKYAGKGFGAEIVQALVSIAVQKFQFYRLEATATEENTASWKILEKAGFIRIGRRSHSHLLHGYRHNDFIYEYIRYSE
ncbi:MAG: GNAT family N-acetyltransferase [Candidatus Lokiarchaeota archaeon]|nr:GNAT family N-acetyltransferase [Candidatus Lokiarchaeota archaeon]